MRFYTLILLCAITSTANAQMVVEIGSGSTTNIQRPIYSCFAYNYSQQIYVQSQISSGAGLITKVSFYCATSPGTVANWNNWTVYLGNTSNSAFANSAAWVPFSNLTEVYSGLITPMPGSWVELVLTTPFNYNGSNLVVTVDENSPSWSCTAAWGAYTTVGNRSMLYYSDGTNPNPASPPNANNGPNTTQSRLRLEVVPSIFCAETPNPGTITGPSAVAVNESFSLSAINYSFAGGLSGQWQSSVDGTNWNDVAGSTTATATFSQTATTWYRWSLTCDSVGLTSVTSAFPVVVGASSCEITISNFPSTDLYGMQFISNTSTSGGVYSWEFGDGGTSTASDPSHQYASAGMYNVCVTYSDSSLGCADTSCSSVEVVGASLVSGTVYQDLNSNGFIDPTDIPFPGITVYANSALNAVTTDSLGNYQFYLVSGNYAVYPAAPTYFQTDYPSPLGAYNLSVNGSDSMTNLVFGIASTVSTITGKVFVDNNQNGLFDTAEEGIANQQIAYTSGSWNNYVYTDADGNYTLILQPGNYNLTYNLSPLVQGGWSITSAGGNVLSVSVDSVGLVYADNNFGVYVDSNYHDVGISVMSQNPVPGFSREVSVTAYNTGIFADSVSLVLSYDSLLSFDFSSPSNIDPEPEVDLTNRTVTYSFTIGAGTSHTLDLNFYCPVGTMLGTVVNHEAAVTLLGYADDVSSNNSASSQMLVVGSFDPNDIQVDPAGVGTDHVVDPAFVSELSYKIRFQNTGTYHATNVVIVDTLDANTLDIASLSFVSSSHPCVLEIDEGNILKAYFNGIMLPDSNANEPESHGYITFRIGLVDGLPLQTEVWNRAAIYFDFNAPVMTNDAFVTLDEIVSLPICLSTADFQLIPNPADEQVMLVTKGVTVYRYELLDMTGRLLMKGSFTGNTSFNVDGLPGGCHSVRLFENNKAVRVEKLIVTHQGD